MPSLARRTLLGSALALLPAARPARAEAARRLDILAHRVMQGVLTGGVAGDLTAPWRAQENADITWTTFDIDPLQDRLFREASLPETSFPVGFLLNSRATPQAAALFEPLDKLRADAPIEAWDDIAPGLRQAMTIGGSTIAVPFRHAVNGLFYNEAMLEQHGIAAPPRTLEELLDQAKRCTGRNAEGQPVAGMVATLQLASMPVMFARAYGGDFITPDFRVIPDPAPMVRALSILRGMFEAGVLPRSTPVVTNDDQATWLQQGRAAFTILPFARYAQLNRADQSRFPGRLKAVEFPVSSSAPAGLAMAPVVEFWSMAIPRNARDKALGWSFIRAMSAPAVTLGAALNGNGPIRVSTYAEPRFAATQPLAAIEAASLAKARIPYPAFPDASRAHGIFVEEVQACVIGQKSAEQAVQDAIARIKPLLPA